MIYGYPLLTLHVIGMRNRNGEAGIRTRGKGLNPYDGLANRCLKPLGHLSKLLIIVVSQRLF